LLLLAANGINHALIVLAAMSVGLPVAVASPAYASSRAAPWDKLARIVCEIDPALVLADDVDGVVEALASIGAAGVTVMPIADLAWLMKQAPVAEAAVLAAAARVHPDMVAKLLFTSGSTGTPKAVINTQRMLVSNVQAMTLLWSFLEKRPPVIVDWLPWSHTFGGNFCLHICLFLGGTFHIDAGKPAPGAIELTVAALRRWSPTIYFNVPAGYDALLPALEADTSFARHFFADLDFLFNAAAPLPDVTRSRLEAVAKRATGELPAIFGGWGSTETAPGATMLSFPTPHASNLGVPLPGTEIKMVPIDGRHELRVRGPNVTPGYWKQPEATAAAFDEEGFYRIGDAGRMVDPADPAAGILFDGRIAENFKLGSGTWVNVAGVRLAAIAAGEGLIADAVVAGEGRDTLGLLVFPNHDACRALLAAEGCDFDASPTSRERVRDCLASLLCAHNARQMGSSTRIGHLLILADPPRPEHDEITEKGYINQRAVLARRASCVDELYRDANALQSGPSSRIGAQANATPASLPAGR
jgi:feruloyl-CoA synthase